MKVLIATPIRFPQIGGPSTYSGGLASGLQELGHNVAIISYTWERSFPPLIKHGIFTLRAVKALWGADAVIALDPFIVGVPVSIANMLLRRPSVLRIGGDFLWEQYVERTGDMVVLRDFYATKKVLTYKEQIIFYLTRWSLKKFDIIVFSTKWQSKIWMKPYCIRPKKVSIIENYYGDHEISRQTTHELLWPVRDQKIKNGSMLKKAFGRVSKEHPNFTLVTEHMSPDMHKDRMKSCYAVLLPSLSDISPNIILEAIRFGKPFLITKETGLIDRISEIGLFVEPLDENDITYKLETLLDPIHYKEIAQKISAFSYTHSWTAIAREFMDTIKS